MINKILFDNQIFRSQTYGGISRYFTEIIAGVNRQSGFQAFPAKFYSNNEYISAKNLNKYKWLLEKPVFKGKGRIEDLIKKREDRFVNEMSKKPGRTVFHPTYYAPPIENFDAVKIPVVITVHDMIHELYLNDYFERIAYDSEHKSKMILKADHIIAISQNTKNDIIRFFPAIDREKISVIYHGSSLMPKNKSTSIEVPNKFILFVGVRPYYKNFLWLIESLADYLIKKNIFLVCAGGGPFNPFEIERIEKLELKNLVLFNPIVSDEKLYQLYKRSSCFIYPSSYEGFGIPILEAFAARCPVILPRSSCFPEIAAQAALFYELNSKESLVEKIDKLLNSKSVADEFRSLGEDRVKAFTWNKSVDAHCAVYDQAIKQHVKG